MDIFDWYFKQIVTQAQMDWAFDRAQNSMHSLATDNEALGIVNSLGISQHAPMPDKTVDVAGPGTAYDPEGQRIYVGDALTVVDCSQDEFGTDSNPPTVGFERYISVFIRFKRNLTEPKLDGNNVVVYTKQLESFEFFVRLGSEAPAGTAIPALLMTDAVLLCDILVTHGFTAILNADIDLTRRQDWVRFSGAVLGDRAYGTAHDAVEDILAVIEAWGGALPFAFVQQWFGPTAVAGPTPPPTTMQEALDAIVYDLAISGAVDGGAGRVGVQDYTTFGAFVAWAATNVQGALRVIADALDGHIGGGAPAHTAAAVVFTPYSYLASVNVQAAIQEIVDDLAVNASAASGASRVGWFDNVVAGLLNGVIGNTTAQGAIKALAEALQRTAATCGAARIGTDVIAGSPESASASDVFTILTAIYGHLNARTERATAETVTAAWRFENAAAFVDKAREANNVRFDNSPMLRSMRGGSNQPIGNRSMLASGLAQGAEWASPFNQFNEVFSGGGSTLRDICVAFTASGNRLLVLADDTGFWLVLIDPDRQTVFAALPLAGLFPVGTWSIDSICSDGTYLYVKVTDVIGFTHRINACDLAGVVRAGWPAQGTVLPGVGATPLGISFCDKVIVSVLDGALNLATELATVNSWQHCASGLSMSRINAATGAITQNGDGDGPAIPVMVPANCYPSGGLVCTGSSIVATFKDSAGAGGGIYTALVGNVGAGSGMAGMPYGIPSFLGQSIVYDGTVLWCPDQPGDIWCYQTRDQVMNLKQGAAALGTVRFAVFDGLNVWLQELESPNLTIRLHMIPAHQYYGFAGQQVAAMIKTSAGMLLDNEAAGIVINQMGRLCFDGDSVWMVLNATGGGTGSGVIRRIPLAGLR